MTNREWLNGLSNEEYAEKEYEICRREVLDRLRQHVITSNEALSELKELEASYQKMRRINKKEI